METNSTLSHGASGFIQERLMYVSDATRVVICRTCNTVAIPISDVDPDVPNPKQEYQCKKCGDTISFGEATMPYAFKLMTDILGGAGYNIRLQMVTPEEYRHMRESKAIKAEESLREELAPKEAEEEEKGEEEEGREEAPRVETTIEEELQGALEPEDIEYLEYLEELPREGSED